MRIVGHRVTHTRLTCIESRSGSLFSWSLPVSRFLTDLVSSIWIFKRALALPLVLVIAMCDLSASAKSSMESTNEISLLKLAHQRFDEISPAEQALFRAVANGATYSNSVAGTTNLIRADRLSWLLTDTTASALISRRGVSITGQTNDNTLEIAKTNDTLGLVIIDGSLELDWATISCPLLFTGCEFNDDVSFNHSHLRALCLDGCHLNSLHATGLTLDSDLSLQFGFKCDGPVDLSGATITGNVYGDGAQMNNSDGDAFTASQAKIHGDVDLGGGFKAMGRVNVMDAVIDGCLDCDGGHFQSTNGYAIDAERANVKGSIFCRKVLDKEFTAQPGVSLLRATIGNTLECDGGYFATDSTNYFALEADEAKFQGSVFLRRGFRSQGTVHLLTATIGNQLDCSRGNFIQTNAESRSIDAGSIKVADGVFLSEDFNAEGQVDFSGASIGKDLYCENGHFVYRGTNGNALSAADAKIEGSVILRNGFTAEGEVNLADGMIGKSIDCESGRFGNALIPLQASRVMVNNGVYLNGAFHSEGIV